MGRIFPRSTKPAPPFLNLSVRTAQPCSSPAPRRASSHPLQNRVPRGECVPVALCRELTGAERRPSPSAPAKNREASTMLASLFFVSAHKDSATRHGCALRSACRGVSERQWRSAANRSQLPLRSVLGAPHWGAAPEATAETSPSAPAKKPAKTLGFRRFSCCF